MNILITGCRGFIGGEAASYFRSRGHKVIATNRQTLDISDRMAVIRMFVKNSIDIVIHAAVRGGRRNVKDEFEHLLSNIGMYSNLASCNDSFGCMFNFGSGAEFDRSYNIDDMYELDIYERMPQDYYGLSKNIITREINKSNNIINLRLFGCFGLTEHPDRFITNSLRRLKNSDSISIHQNKEMDFVFVEDVLRAIEFITPRIETLEHRDFNVCYEEKHTLMDVASLITSLTNTSNEIIIEKKTEGTPYTGNCERLLSLGIELQGLEEGISQMVEGIYK